MDIDGIILFGDSVFAGVGASHRSHGCGKIIKSLLGFPVLINARNLDTTQDAIAKIKNVVSEHYTYSHVIILFGNNDCKLIDYDKPIVSLEQYKNNLSSIIKQIITNNKIPIISNLQPIDEKLFYKTLPNVAAYMKKINSAYEWQKRYSDACEEVAKVEKINLIDIRSKLKENSDAMAKDGLHPNDLGHRIIAEQILEGLQIK